MISDTRASLSISFDKNEFIGPIRTLSNHRLEGLANGFDIEGIGTAKWKLCIKTVVSIVASSCYYIPNIREKLISSQRLFVEKQGVTGRFLVEEYCVALEFDNVGKVVIEYDKDNHLPTALAKSSSSGGAECNLSSILEESNTNLTHSQKIIIHWHGRFGYKRMAHIQTFFRMVPFQF